VRWLILCVGFGSRRQGSSTKSRESYVDGSKRTVLSLSLKSEDDLKTKDEGLRSEKPLDCIEIVSVLIGSAVYNFCSLTNFNQIDVILTKVIMTSFTIQSSFVRDVSRSIRSSNSPIRRCLHLAPPFLVSDYVPRYLRQSPASLERKREESIAHLKQCNICPRYIPYSNMTY